MPLYLSPHQSRELAPQGTHLATCSSIVQLGTLQFEWDTGPKPKLRLTWELLDELNSKGWPFLIGRTYNFTGHSSSALVLDLEAWRGKPLDEDFDLEELIGLTAVLNLSHETGRNGDYVKLNSVIRPPKGVPERHTPRTERLVFTFSSYDPELYARVPEWEQKLIAQSPEYRIAIGEEAPPLPPPAAQQRQSLSPSTSSSSIGRDLDDDIPF